MTAQTVVDRATYTYNQGTFIGAGRPALQRHRHDAAMLGDAAQAPWRSRARDLTEDGVLRERGRRPDGGGFKGIFARYAWRLPARTTPRVPTRAGLAQNAAAAWSQQQRPWA